MTHKTSGERVICNCAQKSDLVELAAEVKPGTGSNCVCQEGTELILILLDLLKVFTSVIPNSYKF